MHHRYDVVGIGNCLIDILIQVPDSFLVEQGLKKGQFHMLEEEKIAALVRAAHGYRATMEAGGGVANTLVGVAQMGGSSIFYGNVGADDYGEQYIKKMKGSGVVTKIHRDLGKTGMALAFITADGQRTFAANLGVACNFLKHHISEDDIKNSQYLHITGYKLEPPIMRETVLHAMEIAKKAGVKISLDLADPGVIERNYALFVDVVRKYADIIFVNENEASAFVKKSEEDAAKELSLYCDIAVVKLGERGSVIKQGGKILRINAIKTNAIDTTGAGDIYASGILYGLSRGADLEKSAELGTYAATKVIEQIGARLPGTLHNDARRILDGGA